MHTAAISASHQDGTFLGRFFARNYARDLGRAMHRPAWVWALAGVGLLGSILLFVFGVGGEFMPPLEEGNLWIRATLPQDISFDQAAHLADQLRLETLRFPEVSQSVSQVGRPDDGTDVTTFNNIEMGVTLKPSDHWPASVHGNKDELIAQMQHVFSKYPGVVFGFSQAIQDNVEEAMSGVKGENSLKVFGDDLRQLTSLSDRIVTVMGGVKGVADAGIFKVNGQPSLVVAVNRDRASRYGIAPADINAAVQAAVGGAAISQMIEGDRRFDITVRYPEQSRSGPDAIGSILLPTSDGGHIPLSQVADIGIREGSFMIYREGGRRYIPIKFSVRGRDLADTHHRPAKPACQKDSASTGLQLCLGR